MADTTTPPPAPVVVIGYGNPLRRDDGAGPRAAEIVTSWGLPGVHAVARHQLTPELAGLLAEARLALFVDARLDDVDQPARIEPVDPGEPAGMRAHVSDPSWLLGLTHFAFGRAPEALIATIPARDVGLGEGLTPETERALQDCLRLIRAWIASANSWEGVQEPPSVSPRRGTCRD